MDPVNLLRRLCIIMFEDIILHESFTTLMWLTAALSTNSFVLQKNHINWILGLINTMANCNIKDEIDFDLITSQRDSKLFDLPIKIFR